MNHTQAYIICATPRSGTTLLCDLLADSGVAGRPDSFFRLQSMRSWWAQELGVSVAEWTDEHAFDHSYLAAVLQEGAGGTQVFGMRLMWSQVDNLSKRLGVLYPGLSSDTARIRAAFGPTGFVHLSREDKVAQAVSLIKAKQSGLWHVNADGTERERERVKPGQAPAYDARVLAEQVAEYEQHDAAWVEWFAQQNIEPVRITYEALSDNPQATLATLLSAFGLDPTIAGTVEPRTTKLADRESREWATRFRAEQEGISS
ncbi:MAG: Stf0 family sulfotransferase [Ardenticatenaceae bacterium]